jgi:hypothetical protein
MPGLKPLLIGAAFCGGLKAPRPFVVRIRLPWRFKRASLRRSKRVRGDGRKAEAAAQGSGVGVWGGGCFKTSAAS